MSFRALFERLYPELHRYLYRLTGDPDVADDAAQESFVRLMGNPLPEEEARRWLFTVGTNLVRDGARTTTRRRRLLTVHPVENRQPRPDEAAESTERVELVREILAQLPTRDRTLLLMREEGFRYAEIADAVGVNATSVGTLLARATDRFARAYRERFDHDPS